MTEAIINDSVRNTKIGSILGKGFAGGIESDMALDTKIRSEAGEAARDIA